jgi:hypothetical protein
MFSIGDLVIGGSNAKIYWLGRKVIWQMLLKPTPNEFGAAKNVYFLKQILLSEGAEAITPYVVGLSDEEFVAIRHDTFLMLAEYGRQLQEAIIPGYSDKYTAPMNDPVGREHFKQNAIDNQVQQQALNARCSLATFDTEYLAVAYSHRPANPQELKQLLDILNVQGSDRDRLIRSTKDSEFQRHNWGK